MKLNSSKKLYTAGKITLMLLRTIIEEVRDKDNDYIIYCNWQLIMLKLDEAFMS
jgi:hypothetical protein